MTYEKIKTIINDTVAIRAKEDNSREALKNYKFNIKIKRK